MDKLDDKSYVLSKFYKTAVDDDRGATPFTVYIINDPTPIYEHLLNQRGGYKALNMAREGQAENYLKDSLINIINKLQ